MVDYKNILIVRTDRIGDVVLTTPAIKAVRKGFPHARITILVSASTQDLVKGNPYLDEILVDDRRYQHRGPWGYYKLISMIRKRKFDLAIVFHTKKRTNLLCFLAGIPHRVGYKNNKFGFLLNVPIFDDRPLGIKHEAKYCLDVLKAIDIYETEIELYIPLQPEAERWATEIFDEFRLDRSQAIVVIHPWSNCPTREWPVKRFCELIHQLSDKYACDFILVGSKENKDTAKEIVETVDVPMVDLTGKTDLGQLVSLVKRCHLLISNDSGPVHIAAGLDVPVVSIFTRNQPGINPKRWQPLGEKSRFVAPDVFYDVSFVKSVIVDTQYLEKIQVADVLEAVDDVFKLC